MYVVFNLICISEEVVNTNSSSDFTIKFVFLKKNPNQTPPMSKYEREEEKRGSVWAGSLLGERRQINFCVCGI